MSPPARLIRVAAAQLGPIQLAESRESVLTRMCKLLDEAAANNVQLAVFPELAFTTFFPRHYIPEAEALQSFYEIEGPGQPIDQSPNVKLFFDHAKRLQIDVYVGYAEAWRESETAGTAYYNTSTYYSGRLGRVVQQYRKVRLPGVVEPFPEPGATQ